MSLGMTPYEFVQQVYYAQEKVILDFHPDDDKYKEVIMEGNFVIQELQKEEDWSWLRERLVLGPTDPLPGNPIPEYELPEWVYKPAALYKDCVRLHRCHHGHVDERNFIEVPWVSDGSIHGRSGKRIYEITDMFSHQPDLGAVSYGNTITFNRPLNYHEGHHRVAVTDVIRRMPLLHICNDNCPRDENGNCKLIEKKIFEEIPDPNYMVIRTAALHAVGSPPAQPRAMDLADQAQKLLSSMRQNDADKTQPDFIPHYNLSYLNVI